MYVTSTLASKSLFWMSRLKGSWCVVFSQQVRGAMACSEKQLSLFISKSIISDTGKCGNAKEEGGEPEGKEGDEERQVTFFYRRDT